MKFTTLVFSTALLLFFLTHSQAFGNETFSFKKWVASCDIDKFTDEKSCNTYVDTFSNSKFYRVHFLMTHSQIYDEFIGFLIADSSKSNDCLNSNVVRIDKNDAIFFEGRTINEEKANKLLQQMLAGKTAMARCGDVDFTFSLNGFPEGYEFVKKNMAFDPLKK